MCILKIQIRTTVHQNHISQVKPSQALIRLKQQILKDEVRCIELKIL